MSLGGDDFLAKPVEPVSFVRLIVARIARARHLETIDRDLKAAVIKSETYQRALDHHVIVSITDAAGTITDVNDKFVEISGYSRDELIGQNHRIVKSDVHPKAFYSELWDTVSSGKIRQGEVCNRRKDGSLYWVESTIVPFLDGDGVPFKYYAVRTDITAIKEAEEALRASEARLSRSQEFANIGTWDWDIATGELYWSDRIGHLFGYGDQVPETSYESFMAAVHPEDRDAVTKAIAACVDNGEEYNIEHRVIWSDGLIHWLHESGDVVRADDGAPLHMLGVVQDITERKRVEQALVDARNEAENANRSKSEFLSRMSHELRTPLNAVLGFAQLLETEELDDSQRESVGEIIRAGGHLLTLINDVLDLAKVEAGSIEMSPEPVLFRDLLMESLSLISSMAKEHDISIRLFQGNREIALEAIEEIDDVVLRADRTRLKQVMINLLSNAIKYNRDHGWLEIHCDKRLNGLARISVSDSGTGIAAENLPHMFTSFSRLGAEKSDIEGTGIGLVICKNIIESMNGTIGVESKLGHGSQFWIELPLDDSAPPEEQEAEQSVPSVQQLHEEKIAVTVLYIEDNPANLKLVEGLMRRREGVRFLTAKHPREGLALAERNRPDLILLDINLPELDGYEVLKRLRGLEGMKGTPVIAISANAMARDVKKGIEAGFREYLTKPLDVTRFFEAVDKVLH